MSPVVGDSWGCSVIAVNLRYSLESFDICEGRDAAAENGG